MPEAVDAAVRRRLAEQATEAWMDIAPLLHPAVAQYLHILTGQVLWLNEEVARLRAKVEDPTS